MSKTLVCDVETNGLKDYTQMWCAVTYCVETQELKVFKYGEENYIEAFTDYIKDATHWVMHNGINFDRHVIAHFTGLPLISVDAITDTLVLSRLYNSGRDGGHSLERWGSYFHIPKVGKDYDEWERFDPVIVSRCIRDVGITLKLYNFQKKEGKNVSQIAINLEQNFAELADKIKSRGFPINKDLLDQKYSRLSARKQELETLIRKAFPARPKVVAEVVPQRTKAGKFAKNTKGFSALAEEARFVQGPFTLIEWEEFNIKSNAQVVSRMDQYGWKPIIPTKSGKSWKICEENLDTLPDTAPEEAQYIVEYLKVAKRLEDMENWLLCYSEETGKIHGNIIHIGAVTHRCAHNEPNTANIPGNDDEKWKIREAWGFDPTVRDRCLVGADATGIQMRVLAHLLAAYTDDKSFLDALLAGDIHVDFTLPILREVVPEAPLLWEHPDRIKDGSHIKWIKQNVTKRFNYAYILGMGNAKAGLLIGTDASVGKKAREGFTNKFPGMPELNKYLDRCAEVGWAPAPDGRWFPIKSRFKALSVFLQGIEAIVMKLAGLLYEQERERRGLDAYIIAFVHDEYQIDSHVDYADEAGQLMVECIVKAGEMLKLRCPMDGDYSKGQTWAETH